MPARTALIALVAAFSLAFAAGRATAEKSEPAPPPPELPRTITVPSARISTGVKAPGLPKLAATPTPVPTVVPTATPTP